MHSREMFENLQIKVEDLPNVEEVKLQPIETNYKKVMVYSWMITFTILTLVMIILYFVLDDLKKYHKNILIGLAIYLAIIVCTFLYITVAFKSRSYAIRQHDVVYKSGWLFQRIQAVPFTKIQHCSVSQNFITKKFNLANLSVYTASSQQYDITIHGLTYDQAEQLKDFIMQKNKQTHEPS